LSRELIKRNTYSYRVPHIQVTMGNGGPYKEHTYCTQNSDDICLLWFSGILCRVW